MFTILAVRIQKDKNIFLKLTIEEYNNIFGFISDSFDNLSFL